MHHRLLFVSPHAEDAATLSRMLDSSLIEIKHVLNVQAARAAAAQEIFSAVLTEAYLNDGDWKDVLSLADEAFASPAVVVTHRIADDCFWAEVLNLGCYDMLVQPFDAREVQRILALACTQAPAKPAVAVRLAAKSFTAAL